MYANFRSIIKRTFHFQCPICLIDYDNQTRFPMIICPAQHSVCRTCAYAFLFNYSDQSKCPQCRLDIHMDSMSQFRYLNQIKKTADQLQIQGSKIKHQLSSIKKKQEQLIRQLNQQKQKNQWLIKQNEQKETQIHNLKIQHEVLIKNQKEKILQGQIQVLNKENRVLRQKVLQMQKKARQQQIIYTPTDAKTQMARLKKIFQDLKGYTFCQFCKHVYTQKSKAILICGQGHHLCTDCLKQLIKQKSNQAQCPLCLTKIKKSQTYQFSIVELILKSLSGFTKYQKCNKQTSPQQIKSQFIQLQNLNNELNKHSKQIKDLQKKINEKQQKDKTYQQLDQKYKQLQVNNYNLHKTALTKANNLKKYIKQNKRQDQAYVTKLDKQIGELNKQIGKNQDQMRRLIQKMGKIHY